MDEEDVEYTYSGLLCVLSSVWLCDTMDCSLPGSSIHGIFQAKLLEWVAVPYSTECSQPMDRTHPRLLCLLNWQAGSLPLALPAWVMGILWRSDN